jgi:hypothetical protein
MFFETYINTPPKILTPVKEKLQMYCAAVYAKKWRSSNTESQKEIKKA